MHTNDLQYVSTFLSHASVDKPLVSAVAEHLVRRGVLAWLDKDELAPGPLESALKDAVRAQATVTVFLSEASVNSPWCHDELRWSLEAAPDVGHVFPVFLGDRLKLVKQHPLLVSRFLHPDGDRVNQLGCHVASPDDADPARIAQQIADAAYRRVIPRSWAEVAVVLDQRGEGPRRGRPAVPSNVADLGIPALVFQPNRQPRKPREAVMGSAWGEVVQGMEWALSTALGTVRGDRRKVRVLGDAQASLMWAVGRHFDRTTEASLFVHGRRGEIFSNNGQVWDTPLPGGDPSAAGLVAGAAEGARAEVAIGVGPVSGPVPYQDLAARSLPEGMPLHWIATGRINESADAMKIAADLVAAVARLRRERGAESVRLFWATANGVAPLAAANLTSHVIPSVRFMEWDHARAAYEHLPMPGEPAAAVSAGVTAPQGGAAPRPPVAPPAAPSAGPGRASGILEQGDIHRIHMAIIAAEMAPKRDALLAMLPPDYVASLPAEPSLDAQILRDLGSMNGAAPLVGGAVPLLVYLNNAVLLMGPRTESTLLKEMLAKVAARGRG